MLDLRLEHFSEHLNKDFVATTVQGETAFTLIEAESLSTKAPEGMSRPPFALMFHNRSDTLFQQDLYTIRHPELGDVDIFLVPVERRSPGFAYQAVFN